MKKVTRDSIRKLKNLRHNIKVLQEEEKVLATSIKSTALLTSMCGYWSASHVGYSVDSVTRNKFNVEKFKRDFPALYNQYTTQETSYRLSIK